MPVNAHRLIRKLRGGAQAHLFECDDGHFYIVKFRNNPQHRRILINEWIASVFLDELRIASPQTAIINLSPDFLAENPEVYLQLGSSKLPPELGWHFGSRHPADPFKISVYDFLPDVMLENVVNLPDFRGVLAFDKWVGNADARQSIFFRARIRQWAPNYEAHPNKLGFVAQMIDHGYAFNGPNWTFIDSPLQGLYFRPIVYKDVKGVDDFQPWLDQIRYFSEDVVDRALKQLPVQWLNGDQAELEALLTRLMARRRRLPDLLRESSNSRGTLFPNWRG